MPIMTRRKKIPSHNYRHCRFVTGPVWLTRWWAFSSSRRWHNPLWQRLWLNRQERRERACPS